jgi:hypothetical protein
MTIAPLVSNWYKDQEKSVEKGSSYEWSVMLAGGRGGFAPGSIWWYMGVCPAERAEHLGARRANGAGIAIR